MKETFFATLSPMLTIFICIIIGYIFSKLKKLPQNSATVISKCENYFIIPALVLNTFMKYCTVESLKENYKLMLYAAAVMVVAMAVAIALSGLFTKDDYKKNIYRYALTFGNFSYMGNAIVLMIWGEEMLYKYILFTLPLSVVVNSWGITILTPKGEKNEALIKRILNPSNVSMIIAIILGLLGVGKYIPKFALSAINNISSCMGPLAMILTGIVIADYNLVEMVTNVRVYIATFLRLIVIPLVFVVVLKLLNVDKEIVTLTFIAFGTPLGLNTVVFPAAYGGDTKTGASMAMVSHTLCVITIPILYSLIFIM